MQGRSCRTVPRKTAQLNVGKKKPYVLTFSNLYATEDCIKWKEKENSCNGYLNTRTTFFLCGGRSCHTWNYRMVYIKKSCTVDGSPSIQNIPDCVKGVGENLFSDFLISPQNKLASQLWDPTNCTSKRSCPAMSRREPMWAWVSMFPIPSGSTSKKALSRKSGQEDALPSCSSHILTAVKLCHIKVRECVKQRYSSEVTIVRQFSLSCSNF